VYPIIEERHRLLSWIKNISRKPKARENDSADEVEVEYTGKDIDI
jgi:hypothetical protein